LLVKREREHLRRRMEETRRKTRGGRKKSRIKGNWIRRINGVEERRSELSDLRNLLRCLGGLMLDLKNWNERKKSELRGDRLLRLPLAMLEDEAGEEGEEDEEESLKDLQELSTLVTLIFLSTRFIDSLLRLFLPLNQRHLQLRTPQLLLPIRSSQNLPLQSNRMELHLNPNLDRIPFVFLPLELQLRISHSL